MGSALPHSTMGMRGCLRCLAFFTILATAQGASIANSTRVTTARLWNMVPNLNTNEAKIFTQLQFWAVYCCMVRLEITQDDCEKRQLAYWAWVQSEDEEQLSRFNPANNPDHMCGIDLSTNTNPDYPLFAFMPTGQTGQHTEAQLIPRMRARSNTERGTTTLFFLYTRQSPCNADMSPGHDCTANVFNFAASEIMSNEHFISVGFRQWQTRPGGP